MPFKRVLILSEGFGSGHTQAAHALAAGLQKVDPHIQAKVLELGSVLNPTLAPWILSAYRITVTTSPALVGLFYRKNTKSRSDGLPGWRSINCFIIMPPG